MSGSGLALPRNSVCGFQCTKMVRAADGIQIFNDDVLITTVKFDDENNIDCDIGTRLVRGEYDEKKKKWVFSENIWFQNGHPYQSSRFDKFGKNGYRIMNGTNSSLYEINECRIFFNTVRNFYLSGEQERAVSGVRSCCFQQERHSRGYIA